MKVQAAQVWSSALREFGSASEVDRGRRPSAEQGQKKGLSYEKSGFIVSSGGWLVGDLRVRGRHGNQSASGTAGSGALSMGRRDQRGLDDRL